MTGHADARGARRPSALFDWLTQRLARRRKWHQGVWEIRQSNLFIAPNRFGFYAGFLALTSFAMGYKVQNNFILLAVIFLFLVLMMSLIASVRNLQGFRVTAQLRPHYFADDVQTIRLSLTRTLPAFNIRYRTSMGDAALDLSSGSATVDIPVAALARGVYQVPPIKLYTVFPFGIATCWTWLHPPGELVVCPRPLENPLHSYPRGVPNNSDTKRKAQKAALHVDDPGDLRDYADSDPPSRIDWKRFAATREAMVREHGDARRGELVLRQPDGELEAGLQYLSGGLCVAERSGVPARMFLGTREYFIADTRAREIAFMALARA